MRITTSANRTGRGCRLRGSTVHVHCALRALTHTIVVRVRVRVTVRVRVSS